MPCYHPMPAVRMQDGSVKFVSRSKRGVDASIELPCGQCIGCRLERSRQWAMRCMHEASLSDRNCFITLTYDDASLPAGGSLQYADFQKFMKRLRKVAGKVTYYVGGEYGADLGRPHFHACIFGFDFADKVYFKRSADGDSRLYTSAQLAKLWPFGLCSVGAVTFASAAYIARYCVAKVNGQLAESHYQVITDDGEIIRREPEFNHMSLKPAIGKRWLSKFQSDVYPRDYVVVNGVKTKPPKYYDSIFSKVHSDIFSEIVAQREFDMSQLRLYDSDEFRSSRMLVKESVQLARLSQLKRGL